MGEIKGGMVFLLDGDPTVIELRCRAAGKDFTRDDLASMQMVLKEAYRGPNLQVIDTRNKSAVSDAPGRIRCCVCLCHAQRGRWRRGTVASNDHDP